MRVRRGWLMALVISSLPVVHPHASRASLTAALQVPCTMPSLPAASQERNLLGPEQAAILGELVMDRVAREFKIVRDPAVTAYLRQIGDRMADIAGVGKVQVDLVDLPEANAVTLPGGRILVARKLVAFARSEDEVAGVVAHEIGHVISRDGERNFSTLLRVVLNVNSLGDRADIEEKYNRLLDNQRRNADRLRSALRESERVQENADRIAIWLMARVGLHERGCAPHRRRASRPEGAVREPPREEGRRGFERDRGSGDREDAGLPVD